MSVTIIELNDSGIRVARDGEVLVSSSGYAVIDGDNIVLGEDARKQARLHPRDVNNQFWNRLSLDPLSHSSRRFRHHADLAYAHLDSLYEQAGAPDQVIFAIPGSFSREQLSLLLGIAKSCPFSAVGLVDSAVVGMADAVPPGTHLHIDIQLHQTVITQIVVGSDVVRGDVETVSRSGISVLLDDWADLVTDAFIRQARFDPLHQAAAEQLLYDRLVPVLEHQPDNGKLTFEIDGNRTEINITRLQERASSVYDRIVNRAQSMHSARPEALIYLSDRVAALPGLMDRFTDAQIVPRDAVARGCMAHEDRIRSTGEALSYVIRLPANQSPAIHPPPEAAPPPLVTHVLFGHRAYPVKANPVFITKLGDDLELLSTHSDACRAVLKPSAGGVEVAPEDDYSLTCNGEPVTGPRLLHPGDELGVNGDDNPLTAITVVSEN